MKPIKPDPQISEREFYLRSFTWGLPVNIAGAIAALCLLTTGHKPERFGNCVNFSVGTNWGGGSMGIFMITCRNASRQLKEHEHGHSIQNCFYGPFMPLINLRSSSRYLYRACIQHLMPGKTLPPYDSVWFEGEATKLGRQYMSKNVKKTGMNTERS